MPLRGATHSKAVRDDAPYFESLADLDEWASKPSAKLSGVMEYRPRRPVKGVDSETRGKLLACHDYKGGYTEAPSGLAYTFNFWSYCDTFIYFSHHRVTIPPSGWTTAAHRQGVKMLGTLIFEGSGQEDCLRLLVGRLPQSKTGVALPSANNSLPLSSHYACLLADLAYQRGFDGYLLNVECPLIGGLEQTRMLAAWITLLESELKRKVGLHSQVIWYDSVIVTGQLRWQDRLNNYNLPFFIPSTGFFTNYTWPPHFPSLTAQYFLSLDPAVMTQPRTLRDIFIGVDVWGRGQHGGGGFGSYRAIEHIDPEFLGLSVALFGHAWTWETEQDKPGFTWETWWEYERKLWVGPQKEGDEVVVPPQKPREGVPECPHGPFAPICSFFAKDPPPNPVDLPFFTSFSPGVGRAWFVGGNKVLETENGWTDLDKNCSLGDMVWPRPMLQWEHERSEDLPSATSALIMDDAWLGGSSLCLSLSIAGSGAEDAFFRCIWLPVQSLAITPRKTYRLTVICKVEAHKSLDLDLGLSVKALAGAITDNFDVIPVSTPGTDNLPGGWTKLAIDLTFQSDHPTDILAAVGIVIGIAMEDPSDAADLSILMGALNVHPSQTSSDLSIHQARVLWADFKRFPAPTDSSILSGILTWDIATSFTPLSNVRISSDPEDPQPIWRLESEFPSFAYFNIYVQAHAEDGTVPHPDTAVFIGTTGLDGMKNRFYIDPPCLPLSLSGARTIRFYVQGITDRGDLLEWGNCAFVDVKGVQ
ncbi:hypothetical protein AcV5_003735 [Taiwanofungus camphoratus]|nr:hypothetical protein AcV5_003735 [Antrodia cinnamomea]